MATKPTAHERVELLRSKTQTDSDGGFEFPRVPFIPIWIFGHMDVAQILARLQFTIDAKPSNDPVSIGGINAIVIGP